jgi:anti-anti-sigma regulatory factor
MELRIDIESKGSQTVVHVVGRLSGNAVAELRKACGRIEGAFVLDLSNLRFADPAGIGAIRKLGGKGAQVQGASPFVQLLLDEAPKEDADGKNEF